MLKFNNIKGNTWEEICEKLDIIKNKREFILFAYHFLKTANDLKDKADRKHQYQIFHEIEYLSGASVKTIYRYLAGGK